VSFDEKQRDRRELPVSLLFICLRGPVLPPVVDGEIIRVKLKNVVMEIEQKL